MMNRLTLLTGCISIACYVRGLEASAMADTPEIDTLNEQGFSVLHSAARRGDLVAIAQLIGKGANVDVKQQQYDGRPLQYAASNGHADVVKVLLNAKADVNSTDTLGRTPLMWAAQKSHVDVVRLLIQNKADVNASTNNRWTALMYAKKAESKPSIDLLLENGAIAKATKLNSSGQPRTRSQARTGLPPKPFLPHTSGFSNRKITWGDVQPSKHKVSVNITSGLTELKDAKLSIPFEIVNDSDKSMHVRLSSDWSAKGNVAPPKPTNLYASILCNNKPTLRQFVPAYVVSKGKRDNKSQEIKPGEKASFDLRLNWSALGDDAQRALLRTDDHGGYTLQLLLLFDSGKSKQFKQSAPIGITNLGGNMPEPRNPASR